MSDEEITLKQWANRKWTSTDDYRSNYDRIFNKETEDMSIKLLPQEYRKDVMDIIKNMTEEMGEGETGQVLFKDYSIDFKTVYGDAYQVTKVEENVSGEEEPSQEEEASSVEEDREEVLQTEEEVQEDES